MNICDIQCSDWNNFESLNISININGRAVDNVEVKKMMINNLHKNVLFIKNRVYCNQGSSNTSATRQLRVQFWLGLSKFRSVRHILLTKNWQLTLKFKWKKKIDKFVGSHGFNSGYSSFRCNICLSYLSQKYNYTPLYRPRIYRQTRLSSHIYYVQNFSLI